jgi:hypothetical protein
MKTAPRTKWWIVSTHVLTTGFAMPCIAGLVGMVVCGQLGLQGAAGLVVILGLQAIGYISGTYYSLSYLKKTAMTRDWVECTAPAIACFAALAVLGLVANVMQVSQSLSAALGLADKTTGESPPIPLGYEIIGLLVFYGIIIAGFAKITSHGFGALQKQVQPPETP